MGASSGLGRIGLFVERQFKFSTVMKFLLLLVLMGCLSSCSINIRPDGSKEAMLDSASALRFIEVVAEK